MFVCLGLYYKSTSITTVLHTINKLSSRPSYILSQAFLFPMENLIDYVCM